MPSPAEDARIAEVLAEMARGTRDLAEEAAAVARHFRPEFDACRGANGSFPDEVAAQRSRRLYLFVVERERDAKRLNDEAETLEQAVAALRRPDDGRSDREGFAEGIEAAAVVAECMPSQILHFYERPGSPPGNGYRATTPADYASSIRALLPVPQQQTEGTATRPDPARPGGRDA